VLAVCTNFIPLLTLPHPSAAFVSVAKPQRDTIAAPPTRNAPNKVTAKQIEPVTKMLVVLLGLADVGTAIVSASNFFKF
jgi:hypothetical protein